MTAITTPVKSKIEPVRNKNPEMRHMPKSQRKHADHVAQAEDLFDKEITGILEEAKRSLSKEKLEGIYSKVKEVMLRPWKSAEYKPPGR